MELDKDTLEKITETNTTCKFILRQLEQGEKQFDKNDARFIRHNKRIRKLEQQQQLLTGKFAMIIMGIGSLVTIAFNALIWMWFKIAGK